MNRILLAAALLVTAAIATDASADHRDRLRREYELNRAELRNDYAARRDALRFAYSRDQDRLLLERKRAYRIDCPDARGARVRAINHAISDLARENGLRHRALTNWYTTESRAMRTDYDFARNNLRRVATRPVGIDSRFNAAPIISEPSCSTRGNYHRDYGRDYGYRPGIETRDPGYGRTYYDNYRAVSTRSNSGGLSLAATILSLMNN